MLEKMRLAIERLEQLSAEKPFKVISHFDTDGITSAAIFSKALARWGKRFSLEIVKGLDEEYIKKLPENHVLIFLDLASGSLNYLAEKKTEVFVFDHHEIVQNIPENVFMVNPMIDGGEKMSAAAICYVFAKIILGSNSDLATLAVIGMVGDLHEKEMAKVLSDIAQDANTTIRKGLLLYPSTRPLDRALEYSSSPYIPNVTGNRQGVMELLRHAEISPLNGKFPALYELSDDEMKKLLTSVVLFSATNINYEKLLGNIFLVRFFSKLEDARELSALINACSRMGYSDVALGFCLGSKTSKEEAEKIYIHYKQNLIAALKHVAIAENVVRGENYLFINGKELIKDTIIGTVASILSHSPVYPEGLTIIAMAYSDDKIKISARLSGRNGRDVREFLNKIVVSIDGEVGGHVHAAGAMITRDKEELFISEMKKAFESELVKA